MFKTEKETGMIMLCIIQLKEPDNSKYGYSILLPMTCLTTTRMFSIKDQMLFI